MKNAAVTMTIALLAFAGCAREDTGVSGSGFIEATTVLVSAQVGGVLDALYVDEGSTVTRGEPLGVIDTVTVVLELSRARAQLDAVYGLAVGGVDGRTDCDVLLWPVVRVDHVD